MTTTATAPPGAPPPPPPPEHAWSQGTGDPLRRHLPRSRTEISHRDCDDDDGARATTACDALFPSSTSAAATTFVTPYEAEAIIESVRSYPVEEIGTSSFLRLYGVDVERLSMQAHLSARSNDGDEYVVESIWNCEGGKLTELVTTLLAVELWRTQILDPLPSPPGEEGSSSSSSSSRALAPRLAERGNVLRCAFTLHVETTIVGLLNLVLYRREGCEALDGETSVALVDYCARCMASLAVPPDRNEMVARQKRPPPSAASELSERLANRSSLDEIRETILDERYKSCVAAVAVVRNLCEHVESLPLGAQTRILDTHDFLVMTVPLIDEPPWTRRNASNGTWEKLKENRWVEVMPADLLRITKCEAQCWLTVFHLTCSRLCRERYGLNAFRKGQLLRLRKYLNDVVLDQLPVLADVMRYMDELSLMNVPESSTGQGSALLMQQVPMLRDSLIKGKDWTTVSETQYDEVWSKVTDATDRDLRSISRVYDESGVEDVVGEKAAAERPFVEPRRSQTLDRATLFVKENDDAVATFELIPTGEGTEVQTPNGPFRRTKLTIISRVDDDDADGNGKRRPTTTTPTIPPAAAVVANLSFGGADGRRPFVTTLACDDLELPRWGVRNRIDEDDDEAIPTKEATSSSPPPAKQWRQLGSLKENVVVQLGFKPLSSSPPEGGREAEDEEADGGGRYALDQAFVSQPLR